MKTLSWVVSVGALAFALGVVGCGGGDGMTGNPGTGGSGTGGYGSGGSGSGGSGSGSCGVTPCGGDLTGDWNFIGICFSPALLADAFFGDVCPAATVSNVNAGETGTLNLTATTYSAMVTQMLSFTANIPNSCISPGTCADLSTSFQNSGEFQSASCTGTTTCVCNLVLAPSSSSDTGTYTTSGNTLTITSTDGTSDTLSYCVEGNFAHFLNVEGSETLSDELAQRQ